MAATTRLLLLGLLLDGPRHGYDIRRTLELWGADRWADVAFGSIYFGLRKMTAEGLLEATGAQPPLRGPARTSYSVTEAGGQEFDRLLRELWWEPGDVNDPFQVALTFMDRLPRDQLLTLLRHRAQLLRSTLEGLSFAKEAKMAHPNTPRHIAENLRLVQIRAEATLAWLETVIERVERQELP